MAGEGLASVNGNKAISAFNGDGFVVIKVGLKAIKEVCGLGRCCASPGIAAWRGG